MAFEDPYIVDVAKIAIGRQLTKGTPRTSGLTSVLLQNIEIDLPSDMAELQTEIGLSSNTMQRKVKQVFRPQAVLTAHIRAGALVENLICAAGYSAVATGTAATSGAVSTTVGGSGVLRSAGTALPVVSNTGFAVGDMVQIGTPLGSPAYQTDRTEIHTITAIATGVLTLDGALHNGYAAAAAVTKLASGKAITKSFTHLKPADSASGADDYWTLYIEFSNGTNTVKLLMFDGKTSALSPSFQVGSIGTMQGTMTFQDVTTNSTYINAVTLVDDPSPITVDNTVGAFIFDTDSINTFMQISFALKTQYFLDVGLTQFKGVSQKAIAHDLSITATGKFNLSRWLKVNFGSGNTVTPATTEVRFGYTAYSAINVPGDTVPYSFGFFAPFAQVYNQTLGGAAGDVMKSTVNITPVPDPTSLGTDSWVFTIANTNTSTVTSAA